jgi:hypothetical protein
MTVVSKTEKGTKTGIGGVRVQAAAHRSLFGPPRPAGDAPLLCGRRIPAFGTGKSM